MSKVRSRDRDASKQRQRNAQTFLWVGDFVTSPKKTKVNDV